MVITQILSVEKYPPSFQYLLMTLGVSALLLALLVAQFSGQPHEWLEWGGIFPANSPPGYGLGLIGNYLATAAALALLYFPCRWFAQVKARTRAWWVRFL